MRKHIFVFLIFSLCLRASAQAQDFNILTTDSAAWPVIRVMAELPGRDDSPANYQLKFWSSNNAVPAHDLIRISDYPLSNAMVIALDTSRSLNPKHLEAAQNALVSHVDKLDTQEQVALLAFNDKVELASGFTDDRGTFKRAVKNLRLEGDQTELYNAMQYGLELLKNIPGQKSLLVITDGKDEGSIITERQVLETANSNYIRIFVIGVPSQAGYMSDAYLLRLRTLADNTAGVYRTAGSSAELESAASELMDQQRGLAANVYELLFDIREALPEVLEAPLKAVIFHNVNGMAQSEELYIDIPPSLVEAHNKDGHFGGRGIPGNDLSSPMNREAFRAERAGDGQEPSLFANPEASEENQAARPLFNSGSFLEKYWPWLLAGLLLILLLLYWMLRKRPQKGESLIIHFPDDNRSYKLKPGTMLMGPDPKSDIPLDASVGNVYAEFCVGGECTIRENLAREGVENMGSSAGILVNGVPLQGTVRLKPGDTLRIGGTRAVIRSARQASSRDGF